MSPGQGPADPDGGPWLAPGESATRLLLLGPAMPGPSFPADLDAALRTSAAAGVVVDVAGLGRDGGTSLLAACREVCTARGAALLVRDDWVAAIDGGADGVQLGDAGRAEPARRAIGAGRLLGIASACSRHAAMIAGEAGADYVLVGSVDGREDLAALVELARWWDGLCVLPLAVAVPPDPAAAAALARAGAGFVAVGGRLWAEPAWMVEKLTSLRAALPTATDADGR